MGQIEGAAFGFADHPHRDLGIGFQGMTDAALHPMTGQRCTVARYIFSKCKLQRQLQLGHGHGYGYGYGYGISALGGWLLLVVGINDTRAPEGAARHPDC